jgi:hypothetical protein
MTPQEQMDQIRENKDRYDLLTETIQIALAISTLNFPEHYWYIVKGGRGRVAEIRVYCEDSFVVWFSGGTTMITYPKTYQIGIECHYLHHISMETRLRTFTQAQVEKIIQPVLARGEGHDYEIRSASVLQADSASETDAGAS